MSFRNIIDVSAADSVVMEQHEYMDKARQYRYVDEEFLLLLVRGPERALR